MTMELWLFGAGMAGAFAMIGWLRSRSYRTYLQRHTAETQQITENQRRMMAQQDAMLARYVALVAAVDRVAGALEKRAP